MSIDGITTGALARMVATNNTRYEAQSNLSASWMQRFATTAHATRVAQNASSLVSAYPWMKPSLVTALASFGISANDSTELAALAAAERSRTPTGWTRPGSRVNAATLAQRIKSPYKLNEQGIPTDALSQIPGYKTLDGQTPTPGFEQPSPTNVSDSGRYFSVGEQNFQYVNGRLQYTTGPRAGRPTIPATSPESFGFDPDSPEEMAQYQELVQSGGLAALTTQRDAIVEGGLLVNGQVPVPGGNFPLRDILSFYQAIAPSQRQDYLDQLQTHADGIIDQYAGRTADESADRRQLALDNAPYGEARMLRGILELQDAIMRPEIQSNQAAGLTGAVLGGVGEAAKDTIRFTSTMLDTIPQEIQGSYRKLRNALLPGGPGTPNSGGLQAFNTIPSGGNPFAGASESDFGIAVENAVAGQGLSAFDFGNGFFRGSNTEIAAERYRREIYHGTTNGHVITIGRDVADVAPVKPNTLPYDLISGVIDASVYLADPASNAGFDNAIAGLRNARLTARTRSIAPHIADAELRSNPLARRMIQYFADEVNVGAVGTAEHQPGRIAQAWVESGRSIRPDIFMDLAIGAPGDYRYVENTLRSHLGVGISADGVRLPGRPSMAFSRNLGEHRLGQMMPARSIGESPTDIVSNIERWARNFNASDEATYGLMERAMDAFTVRGRQVDDVGDLISRGGVPVPDQNAIFDIWSDMLNMGKEHLIQSGVPRPVAQDLTSGFIREVGDTGMFFLDETGQGNEIWSVMKNGEQVAMPGPQLISEYLSHNLPLPDARRIRRLSSSRSMLALTANENLPEAVRASVRELGGLNLWHSSKGDLRALGTLTEFAMNDVWKPMTLLRVAWPIRVIAEEQLRLSAEGLASAFNHPISYISWLIGNKGNIDSYGNVFDEGMDSFADAMSHGTAGWAGGIEEGVRNNRWKVFARADDGRSRAYAFEINKLTNDPIARVLSDIKMNVEGRRFNTIDDVIEAGEEGGPLYAARLKMASARNREVLLNRRVPGTMPFPARFAQEAATIDSWDDLVESIDMRVTTAASGDNRILYAISSGLLDDGDPTNTVKLRNNPNAVDEAGDLIRTTDLNDLGPDKLPGLGRFTDQEYLKPSSAAQVADRTVSWLFSHLMSKPTNYLSRSPAFRQYYWRRVEELIPYMDSAQRAKMVRNADAALSVDIPFIHVNVPSADARRIAQAADRSVDNATLTFDDIDELAKAHALENTRWLLYDLANKSQFFDQFNLFFPFGEAWKEVITRWGELIARRPSSFRKPVLITRELSQNDVLPHPPDAEGFFWTDENGEEVFIYPGTGWLNEQLIGIPVPFTGRVQGLSLATELMPGLGPVLQIPLSHIIPNKPSWDAVSEIIFPFGRQAGYEALMPPAWRRGAETINRWLDNGEVIATSPQSDTAYANTVADVIRWGVSSGQISLDSPDEIREAQAWAQERATQFYAIRTVAQLAGPFPASPAPEWVVEDEDGHVLMAQALIGEYQEMVAEDPRGAPQRFLNHYGDDLYPLLQGKSVSNTIDVPVTIEGDNWVREHGDVVEEFPYVYGLFAPHGGEFDFAAWTRSIERGDRTTIDRLGGNMDQGINNWIKLANDSRASQLYYAEFDDLIEEHGEEAATEITNYLHDVRVPELMEEFPGYRDTYNIPQGLSRTQLQTTVLDQLREAARDPRLRDLDVSSAIRRYFEYHDQGIELALERGEAQTYYEADSMADYRSWLRGVAAPELIDQFPDFAPVFERYFDRLMESD